LYRFVRVSLKVGCSYLTQDVLEVAIGKVVLSINVAKVQRAAPQGGFLADQPLKCEADNPLEGVHVVGAHNGIVTGLAVPSFSTFRVASASQDGTVRCCVL
jgi:enhancer of mRNA-decapping protein 4